MQWSTNYCRYVNLLTSTPDMDCGPVQLVWAVDWYRRHGLWTSTACIDCGPVQNVPCPTGLILHSCCTQQCVDSFIIIVLVTWASKPKSCRLYVSSLPIDYYPLWNGTDHMNTEQVWPWSIGTMMGEGVEVWTEGGRDKVWREGRREGKVWREGRREGKREGGRRKVWRGKEGIEGYISSIVHLYAVVK